MKMDYGFKDFNGNSWLDSWVDHYNRLTDRIECHKKAGLNVNALLNERHNFFNSIIISFIK
jgi:hypothetical protein